MIKYCESWSLKSASYFQQLLPVYCKGARVLVGVKSASVCALVRVFLCQEKMTHFSTVDPFLSCWPVLGARACLPVHSLGEREGGGVWSWKDNAVRSLHRKASFLFQWCLKVSNVPLIVRRLVKGNNTSFPWMSKGQPGNKSDTMLQAVQSVFNLTLKLTA